MNSRRRHKPRDNLLHRRNLASCIDRAMQARDGKVDKVVVKAFYADIQHEKATAGLIVTTQTLAPGAEKTRIARQYPVLVSDRDTLRKWISAMRTPGSGIFFRLTVVGAFDPETNQMLANHGRGCFGMYSR